jgi:hypothetical protein
MDNRKLSVKELIEIFHESLTAIIPWVEKIGMPWKEGEAYDEWDNIADALFRGIIENYMFEEIGDYSLVCYDSYINNYSGLCYIKAYSKIYPDKKLVFVAFGTEAEPMDLVKLAVISDTGQFIEHQYTTMSDLDFSLAK